MQPLRLSNMGRRRSYAATQQRTGENGTAAEASRERQGKEILMSVGVFHDT